MYQGSGSLSLPARSRRLKFFHATKHYFGDKRGLTDTLLEERFALLLDRLRRVPRSADPVQTLRAQLDAFVSFGLENPTHYRLLTAPRHSGAPPPASAEAARELIEVPLAELAAANRLQTTDIEKAVQCLWVMLHGLISMRIARPDYAWCEQLEAFSLETLLRGLLKAPAKAASCGVSRAPCWRCSPASPSWPAARRRRPGR